jgi:acetyltransferase-like isoleucine patch superfamily enzyme
MVWRAFTHDRIVISGREELKSGEILRKITLRKKNRQMQEEGSVHKTLMSQKKSALEKYIDLFVGQKSIWQILRYEVIVVLFSWIPGALGLFLRKMFYPLILKDVKKGVIFGHHITLRHPHRITIGENSFIDDYAVLDAKGRNDQGISIGKNVFVGRNTILSCKGGSVTIDDYANISSNCSLLSETKIIIGKYTFLAGHCYLVAGGNHSFDRTDVPIMLQPSLTKGGIHIGEDCWLGASVILLDGVSLGRGCVVGAGAVVTKSLPPYSVAAGIPAKKIRDRSI